jgi:uncharacterized protein (TIGR02145 family)
MNLKSTCILLFFALPIWIFQCTESSTSPKENNNSVPLDSSLLYLGQTPPGMQPIRFASQNFLANSEWSWHGSPCFSPDLQEMYFVKFPEDQSPMRIYVTRLQNNQWSTPEVTSFSTFNTENNPFITEDGNELYFIANTQGGNRIFSVSKTQNGWSDPVELSIPIPSESQFGWQFSMTRNGDLYFELWGPNYEPPDMYKSVLQTGQYTQAVKLDSNINTEYNEFAPYIDPDEEFLIFESDRPGGYGLHDMYISFSDSNGNWTAATNVGGTVNTVSEDGWANISPDGKYFFFVTQKSGDLGYNPYWISSQIIDDLRPDSLNNNAITDYEGYVYSTIKIGNQVWMAENLRTTHRINGSVLNGVYAYNDNDNYVAEYGRLYTWQAALDAEIPGWHLPSDDEWNILINYVGTNPVNKLRNGGTSGFNVKLGGLRGENGEYGYLETLGIFWTSNQIDTTHGIVKFFVDSESNVITYGTPLSGGRSVRYVKD